MEHVTVLLEESVEALNIRPGGVYVDCTLGGGGHSSRILERLQGTGRLIAIDQDAYALDRAGERLAPFGNVTFVKDNFRNLDAILERLGIPEVDGVLLDLGVSSFQFDDGTRGFSYWEEAGLDMRMDRDAPVSAREILNTYSREELSRIFAEYGEEKNAWRIAGRILEARARRPVETTSQLVEIIRSALSEKEKRKAGHPGRKVFQALRIEVNQELGALEEALPAIEKRLAPGGRMAVITFHSIEDRIVKEFIRKMEDPCICPKSWPVCTCGRVPTLKNITRKPILPGEEELARNSRSRSAKLRIAEKV